MIYRPNRETGTVERTSALHISRSAWLTAFGVLVGLIALGVGACYWWGRPAGPQASNASTPSAFQSATTEEEAALAKEKRFTQWVAWRANSCRFLGTLEEGRFVCINGRNYLGSVYTDRNHEPPDALPVAPAGARIDDLNARTVPGPYHRYRVDPVGDYQAIFESRDPVTDLFRSEALTLNWFVGWVQWRSEHCTLHGRLDADDSSRHFVCDDGQSYPTRHRMEHAGRGGSAPDEPSWAPLDWMLRYHKDAFDAAPWPDKNWVIRREVFAPEPTVDSSAAGAATP